MTEVSLIRAGVIGWPIAHSRSPLIHGYWLQRYGIAGRYDKEPVTPDTLPEFLASLAQRGWIGCNVTLPHKEAAYALADEKDDAAQAVGAANTLWLENGRLYASNTDTYGYITALDQQAPQWRKTDGPVCVLGAGGAARAIVYGFLDAGVDNVRVFNRTFRRGEALAHHFGPRVHAYPWDKLERQAREARVLVNTTSLGLNGGEGIDFDMNILGTTCVVSDIVYVSRETSFLAAARKAGLATVDGLGMLLYQAVPGFERWFGVRPEVTEDLTAVLTADIAKLDKGPSDRGRISNAGQE